MRAPALELAGISKSFGATRALDGASLTLFPGEIHALLGENGAGKSTLVSIAAGRLRADTGTLRRDGLPVSFASPREARRAGIALVPQHDLLVEAATVADNLALLDRAAPLFESRAARERRVTGLSERFGLDLGDPGARVEGLAVGTRQRIEIAGALLDDPAILILDEPTAVLSPDETRALFESLRKRAGAGRAVVLITHRLAEVFEAADRLTLLARGRTLRSGPIGETSPDELASLLLANAEAASVSVPAGGAAAPGPAGGPPALELEGLRPAGSRAAPVSLALPRASLLTLLAIDGNGADLLAACVAGMSPAEGSLRIDGRNLRAGDPRAFRAAGGAFVPGDRRAEGLFPNLTLAENLAVCETRGFFLDRAALSRNASERLARFGVRASGPDSKARELSGGNQQKMVLARELARTPRVLVAIHPTRGLDLGSSADVRTRIEAARRDGCASIIVTADPDEARQLGGAIRVVYRGALSEAFAPGDPVELLGRRMAGLAA